MGRSKRNKTAQELNSIKCHKYRIKLKTITERNQVCKLTNLTN